MQKESQDTPGVTGKFGLGLQNEAGQRLIEFCQENTLVTANTILQQHKTRLYTWTSPDGQHRNQIDYILCSQRCNSPIQSTKTMIEELTHWKRLMLGRIGSRRKRGLQRMRWLDGSDCGSDHELLIAKFRLELKKVGKTARPFRYDLNQIPYSESEKQLQRIRSDRQSV